jgi:hypothetical protein
MSEAVRFGKGCFVHNPLRIVGDPDAKFHGVPPFGTQAGKLSQTLWQIFARCQAIVALTIKWQVCAKRQRPVALHPYTAPQHIRLGATLLPRSRRKVDSATCNIFQINAVAFSTLLNRLAAVVRSRTVAIHFSP